MSSDRELHMQQTALGRIQAAGFLRQEASTILTDAMRAYRRAGGPEHTLVVETGMTLRQVRAIVSGKKTA